jgi:quinol monooxygenase YgiN
MPNYRIPTCGPEVAYVVAVTWLAKAGAEDRVAEIIDVVAPLFRADPGCLVYEPHRSLEDPRVFFIYEQYEDEDAFQAHRQTDHFQRWVLGEAVPLLDSRERAFYSTMEVGQ